MEKVFTDYVSDEGLHIERKKHSRELILGSWRLRHQDYKIEASLGYTARPCLKKNTNHKIQRATTIKTKTPN